MTFENGLMKAHVAVFALFAVGVLPSCSQDPSPLDPFDDGWFIRPPQPSEKEEFCEWQPLRNDSEIIFSRPLSVRDGDTYQISISADFQNHSSDFEYPTPLTCTLSLDEEEWDTSCPEYEPTVEQFSIDNIPNWVFDEEERAIGFRWYRLVSSAEVQLTHNGEALFDGEVEFEVDYSECASHRFEASDHPEYDETYRFAKGTISIPSD